jgi:D-glucosaminate-6-phosphate ammonia-lyase
MTGSSELFAELGITPIINAHGHPTTIGGNNPSAVVKAAMEDVSGQYVKMSELVEVTGDRIAEMLDVPAAMVTPGCASALALGAAACITRNHPDRMEPTPPACPTSSSSSASCG